MIESYFSLDISPFYFQNQRITVYHIVDTLYMASNIYAKPYRVESKTRKNEFSFISYLDEHNSFSIVYTNRLIDVDKLGKGYIREKEKMHRIAVEKSGNYLIVVFS